MRVTGSLDGRCPDKDGEKALVSEYRGLAGRFMIRNRTRVVQRHPKRDR